MEDILTYFALRGLGQQEHAKKKDQEAERKKARIRQVMANRAERAKQVAG